MILDIRGQCQEHEPPHVVDIDTNNEGGHWPDLPCEGTVIAWDVAGECDECPHVADGEYFPEETAYIPEHDCEPDEDANT